MTTEEIEGTTSNEEEQKSINQTYGDLKKVITDAAPMRGIFLYN